jgi:hypothetical protein
MALSNGEEAFATDLTQGPTLGVQIDRTLNVHRDSFDARQDRAGDQAEEIHFHATA